MSAETDEPETIGHMLTRLRLLVEDRADSELLRHVIIGRFEALEQERDGALASVAREAAGRREEAQRAADLADEIQRVREERDAAVAALAAARAVAAQLTEQLQKAKEDYVYQDEHAQTFFDESRFMRDLILAAMRGER